MIQEKIFFSKMDFCIQHTIPTLLEDPLSLRPERIEGLFYGSRRPPRTERLSTNSTK